MFTAILEFVNGKVVVNTLEKLSIEDGWVTYTDAEDGFSATNKLAIFYKIHVDGILIHPRAGF